MLHRAGLYRRGVGAKQNIGRTLNEESILHVAGGVVFGKVQRREHMPVVLDFGTFGNRETQSAKDVANFVFYQRERVTRAHRNRVGRAGEVDILLVGVRIFKFAFQLVQLLDSSLFQLVQLFAHFAFLIGSHASEIVEKLGNFTFLAEVFYTNSL